MTFWGDVSRNMDNVVRTYFRRNGKIVHNLIQKEIVKERGVFLDRVSKLRGNSIWDSGVSSFKEFTERYGRSERNPLEIKPVHSL